MCNHNHGSGIPRRSVLRAGLLAGSGAGMVAGGLAVGIRPARAATEVNEDMVRQIIEGWPETANEVANEMIEKYGLPAEATDSLLIWHETPPWKRTVVWREEVQHNFPKPHPDVLEQFIDYRVPPEFFTPLAEYDGSVIVERTKGEISARCDIEGANFLAINLAHDIVQGNKSVEQARQEYGEIMMGMEQGEEHPYLQDLQFDVPQQDMGDPDEQTIPA